MTLIAKTTLPDPTVTEFSRDSYHIVQLRTDWPPHSGYTANELRALADWLDGRDVDVYSIHWTTEPDSELMIVEALVSGRGS